MKKFAVYPFLCAASICTFLFSSGMTYASWQSQGETINKISMASVKGQIVEEYDQDQVVYPNATVDKIVQVKNTGTVDALPRVKIEKAWGDSRDENGKLLINPDLSTDNIEITYNTEKWTYDPNDGYFYYKEVLKPGDITDSLFDSFTVNGENTGGEYKNKLADIIVSMELVQALGNGLSYWDKSFEELGITYTHTSQIEIVTTVVFNDPDKGFSFDVNEGDLFADFKNLVPGESRSQLVTVTNNWNKPAEIFLWADFIDQAQATDATRALIDKLLKEYASIVITDDSGNVIYSGAVWGSPDIDSDSSDSMKYPYSLGIFSSSEIKNLYISLYLDPQMDNEYKELLGLIKWVFSASGDESDTTTEPADEPAVVSPTSSREEGPTSQMSIGTSDSLNPSTGGYARLGIFGLLSIISFALIPITYKKAKEK